MKKKHLFWLLLPTYWLLMAIAIVVIAFYAFHSMSNLYFQALENDIRTRATLFAEEVAPVIREGDEAQIDALCKRIGESVQTRFTIIMPDGTVTGDSSEDPDMMENHRARPEAIAAFGGDAGMDRRYSRTLKQEMIYLAIPLKDESSRVLCAVRAALPMTSIQAELHTMTRRVLTASVLAGLLAMLICVGVVRRITTPLRGMDLAARRFAEGDFTHRIPPHPALELDQLATSLNSMSEQLNKTVSTVIEQRNEQNAVLSSMDEGVLAIDRRERIIHMNRVAGIILGVNHHDSKRQLMQHVVRFVNLQEFIKAALSSQSPLKRDLSLIGTPQKQIQASGTVLRNADEESIGALIVLRDVTQLRHLETVRSDFIANVSHELKTPITSIKGFVETLLSDDWNHSEDILRFLNIINQQAGRLNSIIDDLLTLSRLERKNGCLRETIRPTNLATVINSAIDLCQIKASENNITVDMVCPENLIIPVNGPLIEQALVNLIVNAVKYSEAGKKVKIIAEEHLDKVTIEVRDQGFGIENKHLDRLFERFYRIDAARSRTLGGTGLGLSIVKHIVQAHRGSIQVESTVGIGSAFTIQLPLAEPTE
ncbi:MAG: HAMP domain-containing protein [Pontiella sp.]|nr:HAMP domain-containing protein [Pontiella sp.]